MYALKRTIKENEKYQSAEDYAKKLENIGRSTNWYESKLKYDKANELKLVTNTTQEELKYALKELKIKRNFKLKELYNAEALDYETELHKKGLAIYKNKN